jgi:hypothetical protein
MFVIWPVVISMTLGALCGVWIPLFNFVIVALIETVGTTVVIWLSGYGILATLLDVVAVATALQFGYVLGILGSFAVAQLWPKGEHSVVKYEPKHDTSIS